MELSGSFFTLFVCFGLPIWVLALGSLGIVIELAKQTRIIQRQYSWQGALQGAAQKQFAEEHK